MLLSDADPGTGRLLLGGRPRPLDDLTARLLRAWLEARRARWPGTANPHLLINAQTALGTGPASRTRACSALCGHAATIEALRVDRQLEEALATGADPCTWRPPSAWTPAPPSATHPVPGSSSRPQPSSKTPPGPARTQGPDQFKKPEDPSVPADRPSVRLNSGQSKAPGRNVVARPSEPPGALLPGHFAMPSDLPSVDSVSRSLLSRRRRPASRPGRDSGRNGCRS